METVSVIVSAFIILAPIYALAKIFMAGYRIGKCEAEKFKHYTK